MGEVVVIDGKGMVAEEVVRWETFLPNTMLRVLLVEADDSTRQIIAVLLRKCGYKVAAVSDGLMAWEILKGRPNDLDLILTEVELPSSISGYALLTLVMEHDFCKKFPMVLKCMLKGAADFLIKPVRRNELRNLWQHVWRRRTGLSKLKCKKGSNQSELASAETNDSTSLRLGKERGSTREPPQNERMRPEEDKNYVESRRCNNCELVEPSIGTVDLISKFGNYLMGICECSGVNVCTKKHEFTPQLEISLGKLYPIKDLPINDQKHALNHSNTSAFSWYNSKILQPLFPISTGNGFGFKKDESKSQELSSDQLSQNSSGISQQHGSTGSNSNQEIMNSPFSGSGKAEIYSGPQHGPSHVKGVKLDNLCIGYDHVFPSLHHTQLALSPTWTSKLSSDSAQSPFHTNTSIHSNHDVDDPKHHFRQSDDTINNSADLNISQQKMEPVQELKHGSPANFQNAASILFDGVANYDSKSTQEIFFHRNDANPTLAVADESARKSESLKDVPLFIQEGFRGMNPHCSSQREAALTKFRLKRKDRSYEKNRKRLAEQRPRVRGQFVTLRAKE
ncbi:hypothetical protein K2173_012410 [Erythroxylum novogranatense]|uniref:Response regulatory domain-containing protein n=1 Tax=Erythroxylum novogranatense TaxID=1862640 RepID=A0AAV8S4S0_9ROSI|nr:hypothetical protein K2173_012410 [Erythroxylum novogranatense]